MKYLLGIGAAIIFITGAILFHQNTDAIMSCMKHLGILAPVLFIITYVLATLLFLPTMVLTLAGGAFFGPLWGTILNLVGATLGATLAFLVSRHYAHDFVASRKSPMLQKILSGFERHGWQFIALLRIFPIVPFNLVNYAFGVTDVDFRLYVITTFVFLIPAEILYTWCGYAGHDAMQQSGNLLTNQSVLTALALFALLICLKCSGPIYQWIRAKR